ncbi:serine-threonine protein kinase, plant-type, putative [Ricinus communis]|uniref:Serine-threonine protein kinase, plant-type, putative n=1 Tax=Ricinus communis TaxID=3988 RepID=B9SJM8_RICCO|nr:serine-threonine protein kinase, plant-type, putative [Ricinus communis]|eukprot:XP_002526197.1 cysteine-rich receptor-like protein kinase 2 [Ricinus communis]
MESRTLMLHTLSIITIWNFCYMVKVAVSDPGTNLLNQGCSTYNVSSVSNFNTNLNASFRDLRTQLDSGKRFATTEQLTGADGVYAMIQCRDYMSSADCISCFAAASNQIRNCSAANGGRVVYDGCFLRYERSDFYGETTRDANREYCGNRTASSPATDFQTAVERLLGDLEIATPRINGFFAASKREVVGTSNASVYAVAQCVQTIDMAGCLACMQAAYRNLQRCPPNADGRAVDSGCFMRYSDRPFFADNQTINLEPFLKTGSSSAKAPIIGGVAGGVGFILLLTVLFIWFKLSRRKKAPRGNILGATELRGPVNYSYKDLKSATRNFKEENKLGEGGFGDVYKGTLKNGKIVAVKKLALSQSRRAQADFVSEVTLISNVHHRNLVRLLGCCSKGPELLLVYEYMANSSLDRLLFGNRQGSLTWKQRFDVIIGTAQGLAYLHEQYHVCIIHRDIKPSNILLDDDFQPKIADFGLVRLLPDNQTHLSTKFAGTLGYTAPEYAIHGQLSEKVDTYSYGIVVLETISGKKNSEMLADPGSDYLLKRAWKLYENGMHLELVDKNLEPNEYEAEEVKRIIEIALMCTQSSPALRPTMSEVIVLLKSKGSLEHRPPTRPPFIEPDERVVIHEDRSISTASSSSNATTSITQVSGR